MCYPRGAGMSVLVGRVFQRDAAMELCGIGDGLLIVRIGAAEFEEFEGGGGEISPSTSWGSRQARSEPYPSFSVSLTEFRRSDGGRGFGPGECRHPNRGRIVGVPIGTEEYVIKLVVGRIRHGGTDRLARCLAGMPGKNPVALIVFEALRQRSSCFRRVMDAGTSLEALPNYNVCWFLACYCCCCVVVAVLALTHRQNVARGHRTGSEFPLERFQGPMGISVDVLNVGKWLT